MKSIGEECMEFLSTQESAVAALQSPPTMTNGLECGYCGKKLVRKRYKNGRLEPLRHFQVRRFCDRKCGSNGR